MGFRGEALSSIASVAKITAVSKIKTNESGSKILIEGGEVVEISETGCVDGTSISVEDLFYNVPARAKFLRKPKTEESEITNLISRLILANPEKAIKYIDENYKKKITLDELSSIMNISTMYFSNYFKRIFHISPKQYVLNKRLTESQRLLLEGRMSVKEIAYEVGFENENYFSEFFSAKVGISA